MVDQNYSQFANDLKTIKQMLSAPTLPKGFFLFLTGGKVENEGQPIHQFFHGGGRDVSRLIAQYVIGSQIKDTEDWVERCRLG